MLSLIARLFKPATDGPRYTEEQAQALAMAAATRAAALAALNSPNEYRRKQGRVGLRLATILARRVPLATWQAHQKRNGFELPPAIEPKGGPYSRARNPALATALYGPENKSSD